MKHSSNFKQTLKLIIYSRNRKQNDSGDFVVENGHPPSAPLFPNIFIPILSHRHKPWPKISDKIDVWLESIGLYRKHVAKDASSLFRCIAEHVYFTQVYHTEVRKKCIDFTTRNEDIYKMLTTCSLKGYVERLNNIHEPGNMLDIKIMSLTYKRDFVLYTEVEKQPEKITNNGYDEIIVLSLTNDTHFDTVYTKQHITNLGICQSILYNVLYKDVFKLEDVDYAVNKMLHDKTARYQKELNAAIFCTGLEMRLEIRDNCRNCKDLLDIGITPFPYKVAKSLDPTIYRNVEFDTWNEQRKNAKCGGTMCNSNEFKLGSKCYVNIEEDGVTTKHVAYIQEIQPNKGPVLVFDESLGEKITVPYDTLELIPTSSSVLPSTFQRLLDSGFRRQLMEKSHIDNEGITSTKDVRLKHDNGHNRLQRSQRSTESTDECTQSDRRQSTERQTPFEYRYQNTSATVDSYDSTLQPDNSSNTIDRPQTFPQNVPSYTTDGSPVFTLPVNNVPLQISQSANVVPVRNTLPERTGTVSNVQYTYGYPLEQAPQTNVSNITPSTGYVLVPNNCFPNSDVHVPHVYDTTQNMPAPLQPLYIYTPPQGVCTSINQLRNIPTDRTHLPLMPSQSVASLNAPLLVSVYSGNATAIQGHQQQPPVYVNPSPPSTASTIYYQLTECDPTCVHRSQPVSHTFVNVPQYVEPQIPVYPSVPHVMQAQGPQQVYSGSIPLSQEAYPQFIYQSITTPQTIPLINHQPTNRED